MVSYTVEPDVVLKRSKVVAVVGASKSPEKEANTVPLYLIQHGYTVIPVNPTADIIHGLNVYPSLADLPLELAARVEVVEVFSKATRRQESTPLSLWLQPCFSPTHLRQ